LESAIFFTSALLGPLILLDDDGLGRAHHHAALATHAFFAGHFGLAVDQRQDFGRASGDTFAAADAFVLVNRNYEHVFTSLADWPRAKILSPQKKKASGPPVRLFMRPILREKTNKSITALEYQNLLISTSRRHITFALTGIIDCLWFRSFFSGTNAIFSAGAAFSSGKGAFPPLVMLAATGAL
jgi:hypothetical protein